MFEHVETARLTMRRVLRRFSRSLSRRRRATPCWRASAAISSKGSAFSFSSASRATISPFSACRFCRRSIFCAGTGVLRDDERAPLHPVPDRIARHGQIADGEAFSPKQGVPVHDFGRSRARALCRRSRAADRKRLSRHHVRRPSRSQQTCRERARRQRGIGEARGHRASAWSPRRGTRSSPRRRRAARRSFCSMCRSCSRPAASVTATPSSWCRRRLEHAAPARLRAAGNDRGEICRLGRQADARCGKAPARRLCRG